MTEPTHQNSKVVVLARKAELGRGKTRLAASVGAQRALEIYRTLIRRTAAAVLDAGLDAQVLFDPEPGDQDVWQPKRFVYGVQIESPHLGDRIEQAIEAGLAAHGSAGSIVLGTDCPYLQPEDLREAARRLKDHDLVVGPSEDGGFYLLACKQSLPELLYGIAWSTERVFEQLAQNAKRLKLSMTTLRLLSDVDTEADWNRYVLWASTDANSSETPPEVGGC